MMKEILLAILLVMIFSTLTPNYVWAQEDEPEDPQPIEVAIFSCNLLC